MEQCPAKALSLEGGKLALDKEACVGCGQCLTHCPTGVFCMDNWDEKTLVKDALGSEAETVVLFCGGHPMPYRKSKTQAY
ncbi:MAG: 4Fe-4S binding protein, partial [Lachnospiraceae bacterium]|nr:4Fe-4S binding protein [Lachnospiraceae bacterium]